MKILSLLALMIVLGAGGAQAAGKLCQEERDGVHSYDTNRPTQITVLNASKNPIRVFWLNYQGRRELQKELPPGQRFVKKTSILNMWAVTDADDNCLQVILSGMSPRTERIK